MRAVGWQEQHWRTVFSAYGRAAFFDHYGPGLEAIYRGSYELLSDFNRRAIDWTAAALRLPAGHFHTAKSGEGPALDWRTASPAAYGKALLPEAAYHQVFGDRHGFLDGLSILDLLMNEGPAAGDWLRRNRAPDWFSQCYH